MTGDPTAQGPVHRHGAVDGAMRHPAMRVVHVLLPRRRAALLRLPRRGQEEWIQNLSATPLRVTAPRSTGSAAVTLLASALPSRGQLDVGTLRRILGVPTHEREAGQFIGISWSASPHCDDGI